MSNAIERKSWWTVFAYYGGTLALGGAAIFAGLYGAAWLTDRMAEKVLEFLRDKRREIQEDAERQTREIDSAIDDVEREPRVEDDGKSITIGAHGVYR